jgi:hypothetical protein
VSPIGYPREYRRAGRDLATRVYERVALITLDGEGRAGLPLTQPAQAG